MGTWADLEAAAPELAAIGRRLIEARGRAALLSTVRGDDPPRIHPVTVGIVDGRLYRPPRYSAWPGESSRG
jgi:hypothetical protein